MQRAYIYYRAELVHLAFGYSAYHRASYLSSPSHFERSMLKSSLQFGISPRSEIPKEFIPALLITKNIVLASRSKIQTYGLTSSRYSLGRRYLLGQAVYSSSGDEGMLKEWDATALALKREIDLGGTVP